MRVQVCLLSLLMIVLCTQLQAQSKKELARQLDTLKQSNTKLQSKIKEQQVMNEELLQLNQELHNEMEQLQTDMVALRDMLQHLQDDMNNLHKKNDPRPNAPGGSGAQEPKLTGKIEFEESSFDFGSIKEGDKVTHVYTFMNTGEHPLKIDNARGSCGCTVPQWPKEEIQPGEEGEIKVVFNSRGKRGPQHKTITITANTIPAKTRISITGKVETSE